MQGINYFYNHKVSVWRHEKEESFDKNGVSIHKWYKLGEFPCDIQPYEYKGERKKSTSYGYDIDAEYTMFIDEKILEDDIIIRKNDTYKVCDHKDWEDEAAPFDNFYEVYMHRYDFKLRKEEVEEGSELYNLVYNGGVQNVR